jgi:hypothetical protein
MSRKPRHNKTLKFVRFAHRMRPRRLTKTLCVNQLEADMTKATCCCGALSIEVEGNPIRYGVCHCENCRKRTGSAFGVSTYFQASQVKRTEGESAIYEFECKQPEEGSQQRYFCSECGTTLYWQYSDTTSEIGIAGGCFDLDYFGAPWYSISEESRARWITITLREPTEPTE